MNLNSEKIAPVFWSVAAGIALTGAFDNVGIGFLAWFALALLLLGLRGATVKEALYLGLLAGFVHYVTLLYWLVPTMHMYGELPVVLSVGALLLLAFYLALYVALFSGLVTGFSKHPVSLVFMVPVFWVSLEYLKTFLFSGFPWGLLGYSQYRYLHVIQSADIFGVYGVSFFLCAINAALFVAVIHARGLTWQNNPVGRGGGLFGIVLIAVLFASNMGYGRYKILTMDRVASESKHLRVSVVQGNIEQFMKWEEDHIESTVERYLQLSGQTETSNPGLIVWPETAMPFYFGQEQRRTSQLMKAIREMDSWFLIGSPSFEYNQSSGDISFFNSAYLLDLKARIAGVYDKVHLVPFGEYVPLGDWLPFVGRMVHSVGDFKPGPAGKTLSMNEIGLGVQICYEIIFPHLSAQLVKNGGNIIINITNDAWFGDTAGPVQHFSMAVFRSVENRRALARSANNGISAFVDPVGRVIQRTNLYETTYISQDLPVITNEYAFYTKHNDLLPAASVAAALLIMGVAGLRRKRIKQGEN